MHPHRWLSFKTTLENHSILHDAILGARKRWCVLPFSVAPVSNHSALLPSIDHLFHGWAKRAPAHPTLQSTRACLPLVFGDETVLSESGLDQRGRRLLRRLAAAGLATVHRQEFQDEAGSTHTVFTYHLSEPAPKAPPAIETAANEFAVLYARLPEQAWHHRD